jgi:hypothetical protein
MLLAVVLSDQKRCNNSYSFTSKIPKRNQDFLPGTSLFVPLQCPMPYENVKSIIFLPSDKKACKIERKQDLILNNRSK